MKITIILSILLSLFYLEIMAQEESLANQINASYLTDSSTYLSELDKPINIPFNKTTRKDIPGFVTVIDAAELLNYDNMGSLSAALAGRVPGFISGTNLHGLGAALVIIDGLPGSLNSVNIEEIEQISILRDVNSAMLYGVQAGRGVIMVTTKRGKPGERLVQVIVDQGFSDPVMMPKFLPAADYMQLFNEARANDGIVALYTQEDIDSTRNKINKYRFPDTDYYSSEFLNKTRPFSRYQINFSGGNNSTQYFLNAGWVRTGSLLTIGEKEQGNDFNIRSNVNFRVNDYIKANIDIVGIFNVNSRPRGNYWNNAATLFPNAYTPLIDTALVTNKGLFGDAEFVNGGYLLGGTNVYKNNIYGDFLLSGYTRTYNSSVRYNNGLDINLSFLTKGLSLKTYASYAYDADFTENQNNTYAVYEPSWTNVGGSVYNDTLTKKIGLDKFSGTQGIGGTFKSQVFGLYAYLDYYRVFGGKHAVNGSVLGYTNSYRQTGNLYESKYNHLGANLNYAYDQKYILNFSSTLPVSLHLGKEKKVGFSPSVGLGWVISRENFFGNVNAIDYLKLKASAGLLKTDINFSSYYLYNTSFTEAGNYTWNDNVRTNTRTTFNTIGNSLLDYEKRKNISLGAEALLLNNSLWLDISYFQETFSDQISQRNASTPDFFGGFLPWVNFGESKYSGIDLGLSYRNKMSKFGYEIGGSFTYMSSERVITDEIAYENDYQFRAGKRTDGIWGLEADGLFFSDSAVSASYTQSFGTVRAGDIKYIDQNNDSIINQDDIIMIGNNTPDFSIGLHLRLTYGNFSFFTLLTGSFGHESYANSDYDWVFGERKYSEVVLDRWAYDPDNGIDTRETATYPKLSSGASSNNFRNSTFWLYDNSRISINRLQLTYDFKSPGLNIENLGVYLRSDNLVMFAKNKDKIQLNYNSQPQYTSYSIGVRATF